MRLNFVGPGDDPSTVASDTTSDYLMNENARL